MIPVNRADWLGTRGRFHKALSGLSKYLKHLYYPWCMVMQGLKFRRSCLLANTDEVKKNLRQKIS